MKRLRFDDDIRAWGNGDVQIVDQDGKLFVIFRMDLNFEVGRDYTKFNAGSHQDLRNALLYFAEGMEGE